MSSNASNDRRPDDRLPVKFVRLQRKTAPAALSYLKSKWMV